MPYIGQIPSTGENNNFKILDSISSYTETFNGSSSGVVSVADDTLTFLSHRFITGQRITYSTSGTAIGGLVISTAYFVIKNDQNTIKLASTFANANNNVAIDLTALGTGTTHTLIVAFDSINTKFKASFDNGTKALITRAGQLQISINGVIQQPQDTTSPTNGFGIDLDGVIIFSTAPANTDIFWGNVFANNVATFDISDNTVDSFTGTGSQTNFTLSKIPANNQNILVTIDGVVQYPSDATNVRAYSVSANVITFVGAPGNGTAIQIRHIGFAGATSSSVTGFYGRTGNVGLTTADTVNIGAATIGTGGIGTSLLVQGNARITGILTVGTGSITIDGINNTITGVINTNATGVSTVGSLSIGATSVISSARQLQNIASLDATTTATIESAVANAPNTFTDLNITGISTLGVTSATNLTTQQLNVSGISTLGSATASSLVVSGVSTVSAGSTSAPSISPSGDSNTGIFFPSADTISASTSGTARITIDSSGNITVTNNLIIPLGTVLLPSLAFLSDPNTGIYSPGEDQLAISTNGSAKLSITSDGDIRTAWGSDRFFGSYFSSTYYQGILFDGGNSKNLKIVARSGDTSADILFLTGLNTTPTEKARITSAGLVGIGISAPAVQFQVNATSDTSIALSNSSSVTSGNRGNISMFNSAVSTVGLIRFAAVTDNVGTEIQFYTRPAAGSLTQTMTLDSSGRLAIGNTGPLSTFDCVVGASGARRLLINYDDSVITVKGSNGVPNPEALRLVADSIRFNIGTTGSGTEKARIDSSGRLLVGTDTYTLSTSKLEIAGTSNTNFLSIINTSASDVDGNRYSRIHFRGTQSGSEVSTLAYIGAHHDGSADDEKGVLTFNTNDGNDGDSPTERMRIKSDGDVSIVTGNLIIGTSGKGIDFSADGNAAGMTSELLDDYEEGTWTPTFGVESGSISITYATQAGRYTKIGNTLFITFEISWSARSGTGNILYIAGVPYAAIGNNYQGGLSRAYGLTFQTWGGTTEVQAAVGSYNANSLNFQYFSSATTNTDQRSRLTNLIAGSGLVRGYAMAFI